MIPITCPNCGRKGTIPNERVNTRMHCKKCDAVFHMQKGGKVVLGEPGVAKPTQPNKPGKGGPAGKGGKASPPKAARKSQDSPFGAAGDFLAIVPAWAKATAVGVLVLLVALTQGWLGFLMPKPAAYGNDIDSRIIYVGNAFVDKNNGNIRNVTSGDTRDAIDKWVELMRPKLKFEGPQKPGGFCAIQAYKVKEDEAGGVAEIGIHIITPLPHKGPEVDEQKKSRTLKDAMTPGYDRNGFYDLPTYWVKKGKEWQLDGNKTLQEAQAKSQTPAK
jgi:ribosomal protein S27E